MIENLQSIYINAAYACAAGVGAAVVAYGVVRGMKFLSGGVKCLAAASLAGTLIIGGMTVTSVRVAGAKTNDTNQVENGKWRMENAGGSAPILRSPFSILHLNAALPENVVTDQDISNRWRVVSVLSNSVDSSIFTFPSAAIEQSNNQTIEQCLSPTIWEAAQRRGVVFGAWNIPLEGWNFPFDDHGWSNAFMRCEGVLRDSFRNASDQIRFLAPFALCPAANWSRYNLSASRAWCATNELGGLTVAVENGALGNDPAKIASARLDLDPSIGEIRLRYDLSQIGETVFEVGPAVNGTNTFVTVGSNTSEVVFRRVHPEDWDYDGLPNDLDPDPRVPDADAGWNQSDAWAMLAYPSNATEIASVGYASWAVARAAEPNRHLVGMAMASMNSAWPLCLSVGDRQVMCDGKAELKFVIDDGAKYQFSVAGGEVATISVSGENGVETVDVPWSAFLPFETSVCGVTVHWDSPSGGWLGCLADVGITLDGRNVSDFGGCDGAGGIFGHFTPGSTHVLTGELHQCHSNAFIDCTWSGGPGFSFADPHSLATEVTWTAVDASAWATNFLSLVTSYEGGYSLTNVVAACVGPEHVPPTGFSLSCQDVLFLNDDRRPERVYPVNVSLTGTNGVSGVVTLECNGTDSKLSFDPSMDAPTNRLEFAMGVEEGDWFMNGKTVYLSCAQIGEGRVDAAIVFTNGTSCTTSATFRVIEPLRRLVLTERSGPGRPLSNPSRLVYGTNAVLTVGVNGDFDASKIRWRVVDGPAHIVVTNGWNVTVAPTSSRGVVTVEARFNEDAIQPRFVLPVVEERIVAVKAFVVQSVDGDDAMSEDDIRHRIQVANAIFQQSGIRFNLVDIVPLYNSSQYWTIVPRERETRWFFWHRWVNSRQLLSLFDTYRENDCIELYFVGGFTENCEALRLPTGIAIGQNASDLAVAHELGHALGLADCYEAKRIDERDMNSKVLSLPNCLDAISAGVFESKPNDWGPETGRGFYPAGTTVEKILMEFLMYGEGLLFGEHGVDIPDGQVWCVQGNSAGATGMGFAPIGSMNIVTDIRKAYTK